MRIEIEDGQTRPPESTGQTGEPEAARLLAAPSANDPLARFVEIEARLRQIEDESKRLAGERAALEKRLMEEWADRGQSSASLNGFTVYVRSDFFCNKRPEATGEQVCQVLESAGLAGMVAPSYNAARLKAWVKERLDGAEGGVPEELAAVLNYDTIERLVCRKA